MIILIRMDPQLYTYTPMYFFFSHLSFCDLFYSTAIDPKMLLDLLAKKRSISFCSCSAIFGLLFFIDCECLLLAVMAYDWYKAVSSPLLYAVSMSSGVCSLLMAGVYLVGMADALIHTTLAFHLCFCGPNVINHFFVTYLHFSPFPALIHVSLSWHYSLFFGCVELTSISGVLVSYCYIILAVLKILSVEGRFKAFSICTSHLTVMAIFQGTVFFMYFRPSSSYSLDEDKMSSLLYTLVIPMLNPLIYSLRNKDVKRALQKLKL